MSDLTLPDVPKDKQKKPRHRHTPAQLAALNELFDKNEHPPLDIRSSLAERLGMETKTVNAWFQNKRASSKKRTRSVPYNVLPVISSSAASSSNNLNRHPSDYDDYWFDDEYLPLDDYSRADYAGYSDYSHFTSETDSMPRRLRIRPSVEQTDELRKLYNLTPHPTADQRQFLAERIGMRYQSITNWFQNQRSLAKKRKEDDIDVPGPISSTEHYNTEIRTYSAFPPPSNHPSLGLPPPSPSGLPSSVPLSGVHPCSPSTSPSIDNRSPRRSSSRRSSTPYSVSQRPRRSRPEPYQLDALKDLYTKTSTPTIEERSALALEIGMDVGKVTNWFRNLRQTARKRDKRSSSADDEDDDSFNSIVPSACASRSGSPSFQSYSSSSSMMELDNDDDMNGVHSDIEGSEDEYQEAVTPPPELVSDLTAAAASTPPSSSSSSTSSSRMAISELTLAIDSASYAELEKATAIRYSGIKIEDALLLLSFHQHIIH
ncbi:hypothetical protein C0992_002574 [Termitomyces sp. T32_za158]|nr:hypothetical protein C0992_002574 [Termitomyces sp. T32_za158]